MAIDRGGAYNAGEGGGAYNTMGGGGGGGGLHRSGHCDRGGAYSAPASDRLTTQYDARVGFGDSSVMSSQSPH